MKIKNIHKDPGSNRWLWDVYEDNDFKECFTNHSGEGIFDTSGRQHTGTGQFNLNNCTKQTVRRRIKKFFIFKEYQP